MIIKTAKLFFYALVITFAFSGLYNFFLKIQFDSMKSRVEKIESKRIYDKVFLYHKNGGEPLFLIKPGNRVTLFFLEGFRTQSPAGMYLQWFKKLHNDYNINIIVPVYGLQSSPFKLRNRTWNFHEDLRTATQIYDAYTSLIPKNHKIVLMSQSFGTLPAAAIAVKGKRKPNEIIMLSPLNRGMEFKAAGEFVFWLSKQTSWLRHLILFTIAEPAPKRASIWDIVDKEQNLKMASKDDANPEDSSEYGYRVELAANWMEKNLISKIKNSKITIAFGDSDLYFSQRGFENFYNILKVNKNSVTKYKLKNSGHMVLLDNDREKLKDIIKGILLKR